MINLVIGVIVVILSQFLKYPQNVKVGFYEDNQKQIGEVDKDKKNE